MNSIEIKSQMDAAATQMCWAQNAIRSATGIDANHRVIFSAAIESSVNRLMSELQSMLTVAEEFESELAAAQARIAELEAMMDRQFQDIIALQDQNETAYARIAELTKTIDRKNGLIDHWRRDCIDLGDKRENAEKRIAALESALRFYAENPATGEVARAALAGAEPE